MSLKMKIAVLTLLLLWIVSQSVVAQVKLPRLISDGMVLQRGTNARIWGWAAPGERISITFHDSVFHTSANERGEWVQLFPSYAAGGPYTMTLAASDTITISDVLIGDVWVCSGQSNMELPVSRVLPLYEKEIAHSENRFIRHFAVPQKYNFNEPQSDLSGGKWESPNPTTVLSFSAVAYFFGCELYEKYHVPIGLINASLGGSPAESWMSEEALKQFPKYYDEAQRFKNANLIKEIESSDKTRIDAWYAQLREKDEGHRDARLQWFDPSLNTETWQSIRVPGYWSGTPLAGVNGVVWYRRDFEVPAKMAGRTARLNLGRIVDADSVFINGTFVGTTSYQYPPRWYTVPPALLKAGKNSIVVRVISNIGVGGFVPDKPYVINCGSDSIDLKGEWKYRLGARMEPLASQTFVRWKPLGLFNGMLAPLFHYSIKGAAWYQGESNAGHPEDYRELLPALIRDWRGHWNEGEFPFLIVQLPNFMDSKPQPSESGWALLREAQLKTLAVPQTGLVVAIDIGEWNDIHPLNKKTVGSRLALAAEHVAYGDNKVVYSGPMYHSMTVQENKIVLSFSNTGSGLVAKDGNLRTFAIAGQDQHFIWAKAKIQNDSVVVWSDDVPHPVAVRYAWADNPAGANLYNAEGLPASPFRTDQWTIASQR